MIKDQLVEKVLREKYPLIKFQYMSGIRLGTVHEDDLLSDYSLGITNALEIVSEDQETSPVDFLHYRGMVEVQRQYRLRKQKSTISSCQNGHVYSFNKSRRECPKCHLPFDVSARNLELIDQVLLTQPPTDPDFLSSIQQEVANLNLPEGQHRILKVLVSTEVLISEEHITTETAKVAGVSRQRVHQVIESTRSIMKNLLAA
jgi:hypothetical protein